MQRMIESLQATIETAARQGLTRARIALHPAELGEVRVHLSQTSAGLLARLTAQTPAAAQALAAGRTELHQSLSSLGTHLLRLDIGSSGQPQDGGREGRPAAGEPGVPGRSSEAATPEDETASSAHQPYGETHTVPRDAGALVDVLA
jgi:flagellar hook-length control protein FliK